MFPTKTSRDVGMVDSVSDATGSCMENQLVEKVQEQGGVYRDIVPPGQHSPVSRHILCIRFHHPYIWQHFDTARLNVPVCLRRGLIKVPTTLRVHYEWNQVVFIATNFIEVGFTALSH